MSKKAVVTVFSLLVVLSLATTAMCMENARQTVPSATISSREALTKCDQGVQALKDLDARFSDVKRQLAVQEQEVQLLQKEAALPGSKPAKQQEFKSKLKKFQRDLQQFKQDVNKAELEAFKPIIERIRQILQEYSKEKGILAIQERDQFVFVDSSLDITEDIIKRTNQK
ncbi:MAG: OmpH family outer membrane protein [Solidesulfovibrio sp.]